MAKGDHIKVARENDYVRYTHHGIDCGDDTVIHFTGEPGKGSKSNGRISRTSMDDFKKDAPAVAVVEDGSNRTPDEVVAAAQGRLGEGGYNLLENNCEHFATHCRSGEHQSEQVDVTIDAIDATVEIVDTIDNVISEVCELYQEAIDNVIAGVGELYQEVKECFTDPLPDSGTAQ